MDIETNTSDFCNDITSVYVDDYKNQKYYYKGRQKDLTKSEASNGFGLE